MSTQTGRRNRNHEAIGMVANFRIGSIKSAVKDAEGLNAKLAVLITTAVGTMACAYAFTVLALISLPAILIEAGVLTKSSVPAFFTKPGLILIVAWVAQTFIQLVLLSIIMVGQRVQSVASEARAEKTFSDAEKILDRLDVHTQGGLREVLEAVYALPGSPGAPATSESKA